MKKFKSILALTASVLALSAFAAPLSAFAEDAVGGGTITFNGTNQTLSPAGTANAFDVSDTVSAGYWVSIPANVDFTDTLTTSGKEVKAALDSDFTKGVVLDAGCKLKIEVKSTNGLELKNTAGNTLAPYSFTAVAAKDTTIVNAADKSSKTFSNTGGDDNIPMNAATDVVLAIFNNNSFDTVTLAFTEGTTNDVPAGTYTDTLTFTISTPKLS